VREVRHFSGRCYPDSFLAACEAAIWDDPFLPPSGLTMVKKKGQWTASSVCSFGQMFQLQHPPSVKDQRSPPCSRPPPLEIPPPLPTKPEV